MVTFLLPKYIPGLNLSEKYLCNLSSPITFTQNPGEKPGTSATHRSPSSVTNPLWVKERSWTCVPTEKPRCQRLRSAYGRLSGLSPGLAKAAEKGAAMRTARAARRFMREVSFVMNGFILIYNAIAACIIAGVGKPAVPLVLSAWMLLPWGWMLCVMLGNCIFALGRAGYGPEPCRKGFSIIIHR